VLVRNVRPPINPRCCVFSEDPIWLNEPGRDWGEGMSGRQAEARPERHQAVLKPAPHGLSQEQRHTLGFKT
jgi:hypothetical protein